MNSDSESINKSQDFVDIVSRAQINGTALMDGLGNHI